MDILPNSSNPFMWGAYFPRIPFIIFLIFAPCALRVPFTFPGLDFLLRLGEKDSGYNIFPSFYCMRLAEELENLIAGPRKFKFVSINST